MQANGPLSRQGNGPLSLTKAAATAEKLTQAHGEINSLRRLRQPRPGLAAGIETWHTAVRRLPAADRRQILDTVIRARNLFRWARRRNRLHNLRWQRGEPPSELRRLAGMAGNNNTGRGHAAAGRKELES